LFFSSYSPLFLILAIRNLANTVEGAYVLTAIAAVSLLALAWFLYDKRKQASHYVTFTRVASRDADVMAYIVTYFIPFLGISVSNPVDAVSLGLMLGLIAVVYVNSNLIYINPILGLFGYRLFEVETENGKISALVSRTDYVKTGSPIAVVSLDNYILLEKKEKEE
jgi:hypothetical protein